MKWYRWLVTVAVLAVSACGNPTGPRFPQEKDDPTGGDPPPGTGFVLAQDEVKLA
jgi:hypothetical protein